MTGITCAAWMIGLTTIAGCATSNVRPHPTLPEIPAAQIPRRTFNVRDFGATANGKTSDTRAIQAAIDKCAAAGGGKVILPAGTYFTGPFDLRSNLELHLDRDAKLLFSNNKADYPVGTFKSLPVRHRPLIAAENLHDVVISGAGTMDGQGAAWWADFRAHRRNAGFVERRPKMIVFESCQRIRIEGVTLINAPMFHMSPTHSSDVLIDGVTVKAPANSPNTDSCNPSGWNYIIRNCDFDVGDDNIAVKPFDAPGDGRASVENLFIYDNVFRHGHGLSVGGQTPGGLRNMHVWNCRFENTDNGIRLKAERGEGGLVENLTYDNLTMTNVRSPIVITSYYHGLPAVGQTDAAQAVNGRTPIWRNISITNVHATGSRDAGLLMGLPEMPIEKLTLRRVSIAATQPMRLGNTRNLAWQAVSITVPAGKPLLVEANVQGVGLPHP